MLTRHTLPSPPHNINPFALSIPATLHADFDAFLSSFFYRDVYDNNLFHPSQRAGHGKKGPRSWALASSFARDKIASPGPQRSSTAAERRRRPNPSHTQQNNTVAFSVWLPTRKRPFFCLRPTLCRSIHPLLTDVDTVCSGLRCPLKTIVPLVSSVLLSFSSPSRPWPEIESGKVVKDLRMAVSAPGGLSAQGDPGNGLHCG